MAYLLSVTAPLVLRCPDGARKVIVGWIIQPLLGRPRSPLQARLRLMVPVAALSAFMNNTPVVAVFISAVQDWAKRHRMELNAGGCHFSDLVRIGVPKRVLVGIVTVAVVPQVCGFEG